MKNFSKFFKFSLLSFFISCIVSFNANSQTKKISLQGFLKDANGKAVVDGIQSLTFKIYKAYPDDKIALWSETQDLKVVGGVYAAQLGGSSSILVKAYLLLVMTTRFLSSSKLARPYICRLIVLSLLTWPSTGPLLQLDSNP